MDQQATRRPSNLQDNAHSKFAVALAKTCRNLIRFPVDQSVPVYRQGYEMIRFEEKSALKPALNVKKPAASEGDDLLLLKVDAESVVKSKTNSDNQQTE